MGKCGVLCREVQKKRSEEDEVVSLEGPREKRAKVESEVVTVKEVCVI